MDEFWAVPNNQGLPTRTAAQIVGSVGVNPQAGKGALITLAPGTTVPNVGSFIKLEWVGATVVYDDLGFFDDSVGFNIPDVDPPITRLRLWTALVWTPILGSLACFHGFVGGNVPFSGGGFLQLPETSSAAQPLRTVLVSAPFQFDTGFLNTDLPVNCFVGGVIAAPVVILGQQMSIEVVR